MTKVNGLCPMGCGPTLYLDSEGFVTCQNSACPRPLAPSEALHQGDDHIVWFTDDGYTVEHTMKERIEGTMATCEHNEALQRLDGPPAPNGRYKMVRRATDPVSHSQRSTDIGYDFEPLG